MGGCQIGLAPAALQGKGGASERNSRTAGGAQNGLQGWGAVMINIYGVLKTAYQVPREPDG